MKQTYSSALLPLLIAGPILLAAALFALPSKSEHTSPAQAPAQAPAPAPAQAPAPAPTTEMTPAPVIQADA